MSRPSFDATVRHTRWWMALSVALNIFLLGLIGGQAWHHLHPGPGVLIQSGQISSGETARVVLRQLVSMLPREDGQVLRDSFRARLPDLIRLQHQSQLAMEQVRRDISAKDLDVEKLRADMQAARQSRQAMGPVIEQAVLEALPRMSPAGRKALSEYRLLAER